jgi:penicillin-binding protein 1A
MWRRILLYAGLGAGVLAAAAVLGGLFYIYSVTRDLPSVEALRNYQPPVTTRVYAGDGTLLGEYARERRIFVPIAFVPKLVTEAFTSAEDKNFYTHPGIDPSGIMRAAIKDIFNVFQHRRLEGASTITQQVAKNFLLNSDVKFSRKIREAILAIRIERDLFEDHRLYLKRSISARTPTASPPRRSYFGKSLTNSTSPGRLPQPPFTQGALAVDRSAKGRARPPQLGHRPDGGERLVTADQARTRQAAFTRPAP